MKSINEIVKNNSHSQRLLWGIPTLEKQSGGDPQQKPSGMTLLFNNGGQVGDPRTLRVAMFSGRTIKKVILDLIQDLQRLLLPLWLRNGVRGRFQIKFGMTCLWNKTGFTLIELLVVVLIIGILAAVAVPQYQKAVWKARMTNVLTFGAEAEKALNLYMLENDPKDVIVDLTGPNAQNTTGIDLLPGLPCDNEGMCWDEYFKYRAGFDNSIYWQVFLLENPEDSMIDCSRHMQGDPWNCNCRYGTLHGKWMCDIFKQAYGNTVSVSGDIMEPDTETPPEP